MQLFTLAHMIKFTTLVTTCQDVDGMVRVLYSAIPFGLYVGIYKIDAVGLIDDGISVE